MKIIYIYIFKRLNDIFIIIIFIIKSHRFYIILNVFTLNIAKIFKNDISINNFMRKILSLKYVN